MAMKPGTKTLSLRISGELKFELEKEAVGRKKEGIQKIICIP